MGRDAESPSDGVAEGFLSLHTTQCCKHGTGPDAICSPLAMMGVLVPIPADASRRSGLRLVPELCSFRLERSTASARHGDSGSPRTPEYS